ncbi:kinase-like domain-containing protein [Boletus reticuloceps]|uniref:Kinase-like domain-containing protein n=1 Tax=Boletus reticuloceps TaxID=495285 RepID=A0A8I2YP46_9AGAM|nr:kinase-like domain-containing protein [Boletus reticuloceps]
MECYICHKLVERHEYTRHVGSHLAGNITGIHPQPDPSLAAFSCDTVNYDHHGIAFPAHSTPPPLQARTPLEYDHPLHPATSDDELESSDLEDILAGLPVDNHRQERLALSHSPVRTTSVPYRASQQETPEYTTIDGQKSKPNLQVQFTQVAEGLRRTTREEVVKIVKEFEGLECSDKETCLELVQKVPIFPGLVAHTYTHLIACPRSGWFSKDDWSGRVSELKRVVDSWSQSGDIQCILSCNSIKNRLLEVLRAVRPEKHKCNSALLNGTMMLNCDILNLAALVALCITGPQKKDILDQRGAQVEVLVELLHNLLETSVGLEEEYRRHFFNPLIQFSKESGYCPRGIYLKEGTIKGLVSESQGGFGFVYKGKIGSRLVAVKALKRDVHISLPEYNKQVSKEAIIWRHLRHPNCLPMYGVYRMATDGPNISVALVSPWMDQGTLFRYLERNPNADRTQLILDVVRGLDYLHSMQPHVAHRDIKPDNILITSKGRACLADFGLVSAFDTDDHFHTAPSQIIMGGTYNYMAPEIFNAENKEAKRKVNKRACDMYAVGCTIYAAYTGRHPFLGMGPVQLRASLISNQRPEFPKGRIPPDMWSFVENLWGPLPSERLTAKKALGWMETKARQEGVDSSLAPFEEEWEWKGPHDDECLWSVSL